MDKFVVTIDGPAASGKSTVARMLAMQIDAVFLDTGAMYRAVTLAAIDSGIDLEDQQQVLEILNKVSLKFESAANGMKAIIDGVDVTEKIRGPEVTVNVRYIAAAPAVREVLVQMQREFANEYEKVVTEGRDQGTVAFPDATVKFFLTADVETRAKRRLAELEQKNGLTLEGLVKAIADRDDKDQQRSTGPLKPAKDAIDIDTTDLDQTQVVELLLDHVRKKCF